MKMKRLFYGVILLSLNFVLLKQASAQFGSCYSLNGKEVGIPLDITLTEYNNYPGSIIFDEEVDTGVKQAQCDCSGYVNSSYFGTDVKSIPYQNGYYYVPNTNNKLAYKYTMKVWDAWYSTDVWLDAPSLSTPNWSPENNCAGPSTFGASLRTGRLKIMLVEQLKEAIHLDALILSTKMRRTDNVTSSTPTFQDIRLKGIIDSGFECHVSNAHNMDVRFNTSFIDHYINSAGSSGTYPITDRYQTSEYTDFTIGCNYSDVDVAIKFDGDLSNYGLKTNKDGLEILLTINQLIFGHQETITSFNNTFFTTLNYAGEKRILLGSEPAITKPQSQVELGEYEATLHVIVVFK